MVLEIHGMYLQKIWNLVILGLKKGLVDAYLAILVKAPTLHQFVAPVERPTRSYISLEPSSGPGQKTGPLGEKSCYINQNP